MFATNNLDFLFNVIKNKRFIDFLSSKIKERILEYKEKKKLNVVRDKILKLFEDKYGLEIGGPSRIFSGKSILPIYKVARLIDNVNFSEVTYWGKGQEGRNFRYHKDKTGYFFICEATDLNKIKSDTYDFVISSHVIEHIANPIKALYEWKRVLKPGGTLLIICPHKDVTFDRKRPVTSLGHMIEDFENNVGENDLTHVAEVLKLHDISLDYGISSYSHLVSRVLRNFKNRCLHHHVFTTEVILHLLDYVKFKILYVLPLLPFHIITISQKAFCESTLDNSSFFSKDALWRKISPFKSDESS